jgi:hypothetical protein
MEPRAIRLSRALYVIFLAGLVAVPALHAGMWLNLDWMLAQRGQGIVPDYMALVDIVNPPPAWARLLGFCVDAVPVAITAVIFWNLAQLFKGYARGEVFTKGSVARIRRTGQLMLLLACLGPFVAGALSIALTLGNPPGQRQFAIGLSSADFTQIITALVIMVAAYVMDQGRALRDDAELTV